MPTVVKLVSFSLFSAAAPVSFFLSVTTPPLRQTSQEMSCGSLNSSNRTAGWFLYLAGDVLPEGGVLLGRGAEVVQVDARCSTPLPAQRLTASSTSWR